MSALQICLSEKPIGAFRRIINMLFYQLKFFGVEIETLMESVIIIVFQWLPGPRKIMKEMR